MEETVTYAILPSTPSYTIVSEVKKCFHSLEDVDEPRLLSRSGCVMSQVLAAFDRLR